MNRALPLAVALSLVTACAADSDKSTDSGASVADGTPALSPVEVQSIEKGERVVFRALGLDDGQAYRATLVAAGNVGFVDGEPRFVDMDGNGAADAGNSTASATITSVNGELYDGAKTVPGGDDDPAAPSGIWPIDGAIDIEVTGVGTGGSVLVVYENGGASTFLEIDASGAPLERFDIGGRVEVLADGMPDVTPVYDQAVEVGGATTYTIGDLDDGQAYRITLVVADNISWSGDAAVFVDADASGTADAGASEEIGLITMVQGEAITAAKTFPAGDDDPMAPSGVFPKEGRISIEVMGVGAGAIVPVAYANGGASTFLEVDMDGLAVEPHGLGGMMWVE